MIIFHRIKKIFDYLFEPAYEPWVTLGELNDVLNSPSRELSHFPHLYDGIMTALRKGYKIHLIEERSEKRFCPCCGCDLLSEEI